MEDLKSLEDYDLELFDMFESTFSLKYPDIFKNRKLYNPWGRKCNFIIKSLKNIILEKEEDDQIQRSINTLVEFLSDKEVKSGLQYLSSFNANIFANYGNKILEFRNNISISIFTFIACHNTKKCLSISEEIEEALKLYLEDYSFLKSLFNLFQYSLDNSVDIYNEYLLLLNNKDIMQNIVDNKNCILNTNQKKFITSNEFDFAESFLNKLKSISISNDDLLKEINNLNNYKKKKKNKHKKKETNKCEQKETVNPINVIQEERPLSKSCDKIVTLKNNENKKEDDKKEAQNNDLKDNIKNIKLEKNTNENLM